MSKSESKSKLSGYQGQSKLRPKWESRLVSKLIFELRKYKLNYLFKYFKSMAESSSIVIKEPT